MGPRFSLPVVMLAVVMAIVVGVAATVLALATNARASDDAKMTVEEINHEWVTAYNAGQLDRLVALYTDDTLVMLSGRDPLRGREAVRSFYAEDIKSTSSHSISVKSFRVEQSRDLLIDSGEWTYSGMASDGTAMRMSGNYITVMKRVAGTWKTAIEVSNVRQQTGTQ